MKQKTKKAASKRFKVTAKGKVKHLPPHRAHFNARDTGDDTRRKHGDVSISPADRRRVQALIPYATSL